ncbi:MAG: DUF4118 domain-containing protein, partial [Magnetococcales bacterium]|nr:DUF4118 domain-containing protein [Magnetococcales bacterium]
MSVPASVTALLNFARDGIAAGFLVGVTTLSLIPLTHHLMLANILVLYLLLVFLVAVKIGRRLSILVSILSLFAFAYYFVPPHQSFNIVDQQYWLILGFMLTISLITTHLTTGLHIQVAITENRERRIRSLYELSSALTGIVTRDQVVAPCSHFADVNFNAKASIILPDHNNRLFSDSYHQEPLDIRMAQTVYEQKKDAPAGALFHRHDRLLYIPLPGSKKNHGILVLTLHASHDELSPEQTSL